MLNIRLPKFRARRHDAAPKLKRPRTPADFAAVARAQARRERKAVKLTRGTARQAFTYYATRDAAIAAEAIAVHDQLVA